MVVGVDRELYQLRQHKTISHQVQADISNLPFKQDAFDFVSANMVVEHLSAPERQFREIHRVMKPDGVFLFHTMNSAGYIALVSRLVPQCLKNILIRIFEGRTPPDVFPTFYRVNNKKRVRKVARETQFELMEFKPIVSSAKLVLVPPLAVLELLWIRLLMTDFMKALRTNIIVILKKS